MESLGDYIRVVLLPGIREFIYVNRILWEELAIAAERGLRAYAHAHGVGRAS